MLYSCARASDMSRVVKLVIDRVDTGGVALADKGVAGFIEACVLHTKGARSGAHIRTLLPLVAPMIGVSGWRWWDSYLQAREAMGFTHRGGLAYPLLGTYDENGMPMKDALQASEIDCYLRNVLKGEHSNVNEVRSHSLKVTPLSWLAKAGSSLSLRRSLGHHLDPGARAVQPSMQEMQWHHRCMSCARWCVSLLTRRSCPSTLGAVASKVRCSRPQLPALNWTQRWTHVSHSRCPSVSVWVVTQTIQTLTHHLMLVATQMEKCWTLLGADQTWP